jgi:SAM-dependent methyltransferase
VTAVDPALHRRFYELEDWYWWSIGTRAIFHEWLAPLLRVSGARVLDVGCGSGAFATELRDGATVIGVDMALEAIRLGRERGLRNLSVGRAEALPFRDDAFDGVAALDVVEHTDDVRTLAEIARVVRPGGVVLVHVPAFPFLWGEHDDVNHHLRRYRRAELLARLGASGLRVRRASYVNCVLFPAVAAARVGKRLLRRVRAPRPPRPEVYDLPSWLNRVLASCLTLERLALRRLDLPIGVSLLCLADKPTTATTEGPIGA